MLKILIVGMMDVKGGIEQFVIQLFRRLDKSEIHCDFLCYCRKCAYEEELLAAGSSVYHVTRRGENPLRCRRELKAFFRTHGEYDYIWIHTSSASNCMGHIYARKYTKAKIISHSHGTHFDSRRGLIHALHVFLHRSHQKRFLACTDFCFACSRAAGEWLFGTDCPVTVVKNGVDTERFRFDSAERARVRETFALGTHKVIGHAGRFCAAKNHAFLLEIFAEVSRISEDYRLFLAGEGELLETAKQKAAELGIADKVIFAGYRDDLHCIFQAFDVLLLPSLYEGFPIVAVEAQTCGLPCLLADTITKEVSVTDLVAYRSLTEPAQRWAEEVCALAEGHTNNDRARYCKIIAENGYDINETVREVERFLVSHRGSGLGGES